MRAAQLVAPLAALGAAHARGWLGSAPGALGAALLAAYLFFYTDGAERTPSARYSARAHRLFAAWNRGAYARMGLGTRVVFAEPGSVAPEERYIFAVHPHGVMSYCHAILWHHPDFLAASPQATRRALAASSLFALPLWRDVLLATGAVDASRGVARACLRAGLSLSVLPGGEREQLLAARGQHTVWLSARRGFVRLALSHGTPLVPCYCFGETETYDTYGWALRARQWLASRLTVALPLCSGPSALRPLRPHPTTLTLCVGAPLRVQRAHEPTEAQVDALHAAYVRALRELFEARKAEAGHPHAQLRVV